MKRRVTSILAQLGSELAPSFFIQITYRDKRAVPVSLCSLIGYGLRPGTEYNLTRLRQIVWRIHVLDHLHLSQHGVSELSNG